MIKIGEFAGQKELWPDGIGYSFGKMLPSDIDDPEPTLFMSMDVSSEEIDTVIELLNKIKEMEPVDCRERTGM